MQNAIEGNNKQISNKFVPITPVHLLHLSRTDLDPHIYNITTMYEIHDVMDEKLMREAVKTLLIHHDALRLRFVQTATNWQTHIAEFEEPVPFTSINLTMLGVELQSVAIEAEVETFQKSLNLSVGPLLRVVYFNLGHDQPNRLLFIVHHFTCDAYSYNILIEDFFTAYSQLNQGKSIRLPPKTTSFKDYAKHLAMYARSEILLQEASYWIEKLNKPITPVPVDYPEGIFLPKVSHQIRAQLSEEETHSLLALSQYKISIRDILLASLCQTYEHWTGERTLLVDLLGHGRITPFPNIDLLRTVGWFTRHVPLILDIQGSNLGENVHAIKHEILRIPNSGLGYGVLRYLSSEETQQIFHSLPQPQIMFNYMGKVPHENEDLSQRKVAKEPIKHSQSQRLIDPIRLWLLAYVMEKQLYVALEYQVNLHKKTTIEILLEYFLMTLRTFPGIING
jgi:non-ribosomal peptide synthase protein (TIGR01720 family)